MRYIVKVYDMDGEYSGISFTPEADNPKDAENKAEMMFQEDFSENPHHFQIIAERYAVED